MKRYEIVPVTELEPNQILKKSSESRLAGVLDYAGIQLERKSAEVVSSSSSHEAQSSSGIGETLDLLKGIILQCDLHSDP